MKISKLFHWLYAALMFLPLVFFIPSCLYYAFNEHATNTEITTINYKYESNEVISSIDFVSGHIYEWNTEGRSLDELFEEVDFIYVKLLTPLEFELGAVTVNDTLTDFTSFAPNTFLSFDYYGNINAYYSYEQISNYDYNISYFCDDTFDSNCVVQLYDFSITNYQYFSITDYNEIESVSVNTDETITSKINYAWNSVWDLPVFSWSKTTFVSAAFVYIGGLFGITSTNSITYLFGYWLSISLCWLVFDLMIYVPNLAHRWLDKGAIE